MTLLFGHSSGLAFAIGVSSCNPLDHRGAAFDVGSDRLQMLETAADGLVVLTAVSVRDSLELKQTILGGPVLRARTPAGIDQEIYALLLTYQALRITIADATLGVVDADRASFTIALNTARDQLIAAAVHTPSDCDHLLPTRPCRN